MLSLRPSRPVVPLTLLLAATWGGCKQKEDDAEVPMPLDITGMGTDVAIAPGASDSQAEPSTVILDDGTILAAWMDLKRYDIYVKWSRSTDGGATWSDIEKIDPDSYPYQNDPVLLDAGDYVYLTWLDVDNANATSSGVLCADSTDGGATWSEPIRLTEQGDFVDRQWMATDASGRAVLSWDRFQGNLMYQDVAETTGGCANFGDTDTIASGSFLNGVPVITASGDVYYSRTAYSRQGQAEVTLTHAEGGDWVDTVVQTELVEAEAAEEAMAERPGAEGAEGEDEQDDIYTEEELWELLQPAFTRRHRFDGEVHQPRRAGGSGGFDGFYSPVTGALADGSIVITTALFESGSYSKADTVFYRYDPVADTTTSGLILNRDAAGAEQMEPWMALDNQGGIHVSWFDRREGDWRLYGSSSVDDGATWTEYTIGDETFNKGFDDYDTYAWVGHFQGLSANGDTVAAVWCDGRDSNTAFCFFDKGQ